VLAIGWNEGKTQGKHNVSKRQSQNRRKRMGNRRAGKPAGPSANLGPNSIGKKKYTFLIFDFLGKYFSNCRIFHSATTNYLLTVSKKCGVRFFLHPPFWSP
jgi:hypothetical protein